MKEPDIPLKYKLALTEYRCGECENSIYVALERDKLKCPRIWCKGELEEIISFDCYVKTKKE